MKRITILYYIWEVACQPWPWRPTVPTLLTKGGPFSWQVFLSDQGRHNYETMRQEKETQPGNQLDNRCPSLTFTVELLSVLTVSCQWGHSEGGNCIWFTFGPPAQSLALGQSLLLFIEGSSHNSGDCWSFPSSLEGPNTAQGSLLPC